MPSITAVASRCVTIFLRYSAIFWRVLSLTVHPLPDWAWGEHADAHAVITDYQRLTDSKRTDVARALRDALEKKILIKPTK
jgi:hypothetical protein